MVTCSFCGYNLAPGTGKMLVLKDGKILYFDKLKCEKNMIKLGRKPRTTGWTASYHALKAQERHGASAKSAGSSPLKKGQGTKESEASA